MRSKISLIIVIGFLTSLLLPFTNCGEQAPSPLFQELNSQNCLEAESEDCGSMSVEMLEIQIETPDNIQIPAGAQGYFIAGVCNAGGFYNNEITWEVYNINQALIASSQNSGTSSSCNNGRFISYIQFNQAAQSALYVRVKILGINESGASFDNPSLGEDQISLLPVSGG